MFAVSTTLHCTVSPTRFSTSQINKLSVCYFSEISHGKVKRICSDVTTSLDANFQYVPVKADALSHNKSFEVHLALAGKLDTYTTLENCCFLDLEELGRCIRFLK